MFPIFSKAQWRGFLFVVFLALTIVLFIAFFIGVGLGGKWSKENIQKAQTDSIDAGRKRVQDSLFNDYLSKQNQ